MPVIPALRRWRQEKFGEFWASLGYLVRQNKNKTTKTL
jgi:hypothetical protein